MARAKAGTETEAKAGAETGAETGAKAGTETEAKVRTKAEAEACQPVGRVRQLGCCHNQAIAGGSWRGSRRGSWCGSRRGCFLASGGSAYAVLDVHPPP